MGWSCRADAGDTERRISAACVAQTGSQNVYEVDGKRYFYEGDRREYRDGRITGQIFCLATDRKPDDTAFLVGGFTISPDGDVTRGPKWFRELAEKKGPEPHKPGDPYAFNTPGEWR